MKFIYLCTATLFLLKSTHLFSQTKFIAHRSHSGLDETFTLTGEGNFGEIRRNWYHIDTAFQVESVEESSEGKEQTTPTTPEPGPQALPKENRKVSAPEVPSVAPPPTPAAAPTIDTLNQSEPAADSLQPNISTLKKSKSKQQSVAQNISRNDTGKNRESLIWLALGLGFPAIVTVGRNLWKGTDDKEA
ncbi:MAG: hypothetical protein AB7H80_02635 [Candidatus Kapaibacterium sp.]